MYIDQKCKRLSRVNHGEGEVSQELRALITESLDPVSRMLTGND